MSFVKEEKIIKQVEEMASIVTRMANRIVELESINESIDEQCEKLKLEKEIIKQDYDDFMNQMERVAQRSLEKMNDVATSMSMAREDRMTESSSSSSTRKTFPMCITCITKHADVAPMKCGHLSMCKDCATKWVTRSRDEEDSDASTCPVCRGSFEPAVVIRS